MVALQRAFLSAVVGLLTLGMCFAEMIVEAKSEGVPRSDTVRQQPAGGKRIALVLGNGAYKYAPHLKNPLNDANAISTMLAGLDFQVIKGVDLKRSELQKKLRQFARGLSKTDVALFFYAGHGLQIDGVNYLVPTDAKVATEDDVEFELVALRSVIALMERKTTANLVFLDACRDNPLARNLARNMGTRSTSIGRGLAKVKTGLGTFVAFATQPGNVALDGQGTNSPFTDGILKHIATPDLDIALMMRRVRRDVLTATKGKQVPWTNSSLTDPFHFVRTPAATSSQSSSSSSQSRFQQIVAAYNATKQVGSCEAHAAFEASYSKTLFARLSAEWRKNHCVPQSPGALIRALQTELKRVGCYDGLVDGNWGNGSRLALKRFIQRSNTKLAALQPSAEAYRTLKAQEGGVCSAKDNFDRTNGASLNSMSAAPAATSRREGLCQDGNMDHCQLGCDKGNQMACTRLKTMPKDKRYSGGLCATGNLDHCEFACKTLRNAGACAQLKKNAGKTRNAPRPGNDNAVVQKNVVKRAGNTCRRETNYECRKRVCAAYGGINALCKRKYRGSGICLGNNLKIVCR